MTFDPLFGLRTSTPPFVEHGYRRVGETDAHLLYECDRGVLTIHKPNDRGDVAEIEAHRACYVGKVEPADWDVHWCD